ncbi:MAG: peroxiredoxin family protein, partial [Vampirovibrionales bacterium]|nr:peroxiredoxin family protein [Vampirovibrionales bacterium]
MNRTVQSVVAIVLAIAFGVGTFWVLFSENEPSQPSQPPNQSNPLPQSAMSSDGSQGALSPDLTKVSPYQFLDLIPVGHDAPDLALPTVPSGRYQLSSAKGVRNTVLIFYQGSFCSVCGAQLQNLQTNLEAFKKADADIVAISADDKPHAMKTLGEHGLSFRVAYDPDKTIIKRFGVTNIAKGGIAWPSAYIINKQGKVAYAYASETGDRIYSAQLLAELAKLK